MKSRTTRLTVGLAVCCLLFFSFLASAQTPGLIVRPAGGPYNAVLDPNQDGFTSPSAVGYATTDVGAGYSEIPYRIIPPFKLEPTSDLMRGPNERFSDLVRLNADESGMYVYNDGVNMLFRLRVGDIMSGSKGYSILIDADQKFGASGPYADPNYQPATTGNNGNPGFEFEVVLETNFRVAVYNVDGGSSPILLSSYALNTHSQISLSISNVSGTPDYFYDFYVPLTALTSSAATITATTPIRISGTTVMSPQAALGGPKSDIYGYDGADYMKAWETIISSQPPFTPNDVRSTGSGVGATCTAAPTLNGPIAIGTVTLSGSWAPADASRPSSATITLYRIRNGVTSVINSTTNTGSTWSVSGVATVDGDVFYTKAQATGESSCLQSNSVTVLGCQPTNMSSVSSITVTCGTTRGFDGTAPANAIVRIYTVTPSGYTLFADQSTTTYKVSRPGAATRWIYDDANVNSSNPCTGGAADVAAGSYAITIQEPGKCESDYFYYCNGLGATTAMPVIAQAALYTGHTTVLGTAAADATVRVFVNGQLKATTTATGGNYAFSTLSLSLGDVVDVYAQATGQCISAKATRTVTCYTAPPIINTDNAGNLAGGATTITGTSSEPSGTTIRIYNSANTLLTTTTVQNGGTWSATVSVTAGTSYYATAQNGSCSVSAQSATAAALSGNATIRCGTITSPVAETASSVSGTLSGTAVANTVVRLLADGIVISTVTTANNTWSVPVNTTITNAIYPGAVLTIEIQESGRRTETCAAAVTVACAAPANPSVVPTTAALSAANGKTIFTISSSQSGVLYTLEDLSGSDKGVSVFGNGGSVTITSDAVLTPGTYNFRINAIKFTGTCGSGSTPITLTVGDADSDGIADVADIDDDNDGILDTAEIATYNATGDGDGDGIPNYKDAAPGVSGLPATDSNSDGILDYFDTDRDGIINQFDLDADNDGIPDIAEAGGTDSNNDGKVDGNTDADGDGLRDAVDTNTSGAAGSNGIAALDFDTDGVPDFKDLDADGDGILDTRESGLAGDTNNDGVIKTGDTGFADADANGWADAIDALSSLSLTNTDNGGNPNYRDIDSDNDGIVDIIEAQATGGYLAPLGTDTDGDGIDNRYDNNTAAFGGNAANGLTPVNTDGTDLADYLDSDADNDGYPDFIEGHDANGDNVPDSGSPAAGGIAGSADADNDGLLDGYDNNTAAAIAHNGTMPTGYPNMDGGTSERDWRETANTDTDGLTNLSDIDDDNDGITDVAENGGVDPLGDADNDGIYNYLDPMPGGLVPAFRDANGDGISDVFDADRDGVINSLDLDSDNDGIPDLVEAGGVDVNGDGKADGTIDLNNNGLTDLYEGLNVLVNKDTDGDGIANAQDLDSDNDGLPDVVEAAGIDGDNDGRLDGAADSNGDGWADIATGMMNALIVGMDSNSDGKADGYTRADFDGDHAANPYDLDSDGDGTLDVREAGLNANDTNSNGVINGADAGYADANGDGWGDAADALSSLSVINTDNAGMPDYLDIDADDDGITDNVEAQATASYLPPLGIDLDKDGIDDLYDNNTLAFGGNLNNGITPVNTDGADEPDYRDTDTDNDNDPDVVEGNDLNVNKKADDIPMSIPATDTDEDGLLDFFESNINSGPVVTIFGFGGLGSGGKSTAQKTLPSATERDWRNASFSLLAFSLLPVDFVSVTASARPNAVTVNWAVMAEEEVGHYVVERSIDGKPFTPIGTVAYKAATASSQEYSYLDRTLSGTRLAYRIRQVDEDGSFTMSQVVVVQINGSVTTLSLYPNPVQAASRIYLTAAAVQNVNWRITDLQGRLMVQQTAVVREGRNILTLPVLQQLPPGVYLLSATIDRKLHVVKFIKQ